MNPGDFPGVGHHSTAALIGQSVNELSFIAVFCQLKGKECGWI
jgi:hypothetical protein